MTSTNRTTGAPIEGAVALVTGGHRGFGRAVVDELLERGATKVYVTSRSEHAQRDPRIVPLILDVTDDGSVAAAAQAAPDVSIVAGDFEILADDTTRSVRSRLLRGRHRSLRAARSHMSSDPSALSLPPATAEVIPFTVQVPEQAITDLQSRIRGARWPEREPVNDWSQGVPLSEAQDFVGYWANGYDWRRLEAEINSFGNCRTLLDGLGIHFIHAASPHANALPLILTHGWPGSIVEFLDSIGPLVDPVRYGGTAEDAFHVVVPSLPGFGFSDRPSEPACALPARGLS